MPSYLLSSLGRTLVLIGKEIQPCGSELCSSGSVKQSGHPQLALFPGLGASSFGGQFSFPGIHLGCSMGGGRWPTVFSRFPLYVLFAVLTPVTGVYEELNSSLYMGEILLSVCDAICF